MLIDANIECLYDPNVGTMPVQEGAPHEKPYKPPLLLAHPGRISWCQGPTLISESDGIVTPAGVLILATIAPLVTD